MSFLSNDLAWWVTVIDLPAMAGLLGFIWHTRRETLQANSHLQTLLEKRSAQYRDALNGFKLEAAKTYASQGQLKALETRLVDHLLRIESKLDVTALKTEALGAATQDKGRG